MNIRGARLHKNDYSLLYRKLEPRLKFGIRIYFSYSEAMYTSATQAKSSLSTCSMVLHYRCDRGISLKRMTAKTPWWTFISDDVLLWLRRLTIYPPSPVRFVLASAIIARLPDSREGADPTLHRVLASIYLIAYFARRLVSCGKLR